MARRIGWMAAGLAFAAGVALTAPRETVRVGLVESLFRDVSEGSIKGSIEEFKAQMEAETGQPGEAVRVADAWKLGEQLTQRKLQLGVFHGFELAWARQKYPKLRPLVVAVNQRPDAEAVVLVAANSPFRDTEALKGKALALPQRSKAHCRLFLERLCRKAGQKPEAYFAKVTTPPTSEDALDDIVDGVVQAAVIDRVTVDRYQVRKPARFAKLKELAKSPPFPPTAVVYEPGAVDEATLERFRGALLKLHQSTKGKQVLLTWRLTSFEPVPGDYDRQLEEIAKAYPPAKD